MTKKVILISGGSDGLGLNIAEKLSLNHRVVILARDEEKLRQISEEISCDYLVCDVSDYSSVEKAVVKLLDKYKAIDILINNAGVWTEGQLEDCDPQKIQEIIQVNTLGTIYLTRAVIPAMKAKKSGRIINIISQDGLKAKKNRSVYTASKWAITGFTKALIEDLSPHGIGVTGIYPGLLNTKLFEKQGQKRDLKNSLPLSEVSSIVEYVINLSSDTLLPDISIKNIKNQTPMDDTSTPQIGLDINPDLITPQTGTPAMAPAAPATTTTPVSTPSATPLVSTGVIDITPGAPDQSHPASLTDITPTSSPVSTPGINLPVDKGVIDITPDAPVTPVEETIGGSHLADIVPQTTSITTPPIAPDPVVSAPAPTTAPISTPPASPAPAASASFAEDPDSVKLA